MTRPRRQSRKLTAYHEARHADVHGLGVAVKPRAKRLEELTKAIVAVGKPGEGGRGFVVEIDRQRLVITAAHCLPPLSRKRRLPLPHLVSFPDERTYRALLGPLEAKPTVSAECLFLDPIADIAVLGAPDEQHLAAEY